MKSLKWRYNDSNVERSQHQIISDDYDFELERLVELRT